MATPPQAEVKSVAAKEERGTELIGSALRHRASIIQSITTPLGLFACALLGAELVLAVTALSADGVARILLITAMAIAFLAVISLTAFFELTRPGFVSGQFYPPPTPPFSSPAKVVKKVKVFCGASADDWANFGFGTDEQILHDAFGKENVISSDILDSSELHRALSSTQFDIIHIFAHVDSVTGDLEFGGQDTLSAGAFGELLRLSKPSLVVLAACESIPLAANVIQRCNMIALYHKVTITSSIAWTRAFYDFLKNGQPLTAAFEYAKLRVSDAPFALFLKDDFCVHRKPKSTSGAREAASTVR